ncbi:hypothetical protein [Amycolatopsis dendrobii]|uniref:Flagellar basal body-associated protein FliL n=1 Tax=Amycolatopsis dendrobii TaxID=2760662 RepID=A0A7W3W1N6_9PSEU|nr:hypothetical protein [Amycolatopsis dendrobii]MBB1156677.1 hypothetical protein [Amycolatopsis dendrobii]
MSWQEELRRLDAELAAGRLGHAEHRRQRDELLAEASGGGAASPVASPLRQDAAPASESPTWSTPTAQATPAGSDSPAAAESSTSADNSASTTQVVTTMAEHEPTTTLRVDTTSPGTPPGGTTAPEQPAANPATSTSPAAPSFSQQQAPATPPPAPASQATPPPPHQPQPQMPAQPGTWPGVAPVQWHTPGQQQQPNQPVVGWASTNPAMPAPEPPAVEAFLNSAAAAPPAEKPQPAFSHTPGTPFSTDRPTTAPSPADDRPTAVFGAIPANGGQPEPRRLWEDDAKPRRGKPTWLFLSLAVLVVLALVVGGIWFLGNKKDSNDTAAQPPAASSAPNTQPASLEDKLPALQGTPSQENSTMALDKAVQAKAVSDADANLMRAAGADQLVYHAYAGTDGGTTLIAVPTPSKAQAGQLVQGLRQNLVTGGFDSSPLGPAATDLLYTGSSPAGRVMAFWYTSGGVSVGIGVSGPVGQDPAALRSRMEEIRAKVTAALPAG